MEAGLADHALFPVYQRLSARFASDLEQERDVLLARSALLMLLQETTSGAA